jgi:uncharacterized membrane protein YbhN (UPF0104 family)
MSARHRLWLAVRIVGTVSVFAWLFHVIDWSAAAGITLRLKPATVGKLGAAYGAFLLVGFCRLLVVVRSFRETAVGIPAFAWYFMVATSLGAFTPAQSGEMSMALFLRRHGVGMDTGLAAVVIDKLSMLVVLGGSGLIAVYLYLPREVFWPVFGTVGIIVIAFAAVGASGIRLLEQSRPALLRTVGAMLRHAWSFRALHPLGAATALVLALVRAGLGSLMLYIAIAALGADPIAYKDVFFLSAIGRLVTYLPISLNGLGVLEGTTVLLLQRVGVPHEVTLGAVLLNRVIHYGVAGIVTVCGLVLPGTTLALPQRRNP